MEVQSVVHDRLYRNVETKNIDEFQSIFKTYYPQVVRQLMRYCKEQSTAEDLAQTVFIQLFDIDWNDIENIPAWLTKSAKFAALNYIRNEKRYREREKKEMERTKTVCESSEEQVMHKEEQKLVQKALDRLNERERKLLMLKYSGYQYKEIAEELQLEQASVGKMIARSKRKFQKLFETMRGESE
ncbi:sigma-70 family RNA polymerase sigma factor [Bacillus solimangrovi]|uniref:HTH luxR-type domain-containing protein n=1 Tax=Bacillus solimangrovi TaxID=1305675 RepID=A0A1E5LHE8_9BACI|nr:sigma-70 family RNA polymerase sigma factor [Bacillus solimangrovi]OEH93500.1 hypothetical protein BFG57_00460 [Bacillus solimangrovi]